MRTRCLLTSVYVSQQAAFPTHNPPTFIYDGKNALKNPKQIFDDEYAIKKNWTIFKQFPTNFLTIQLSFVGIDSSSPPSVNTAIFHYSVFSNILFCPCFSMVVTWTVSIYWP